MILIAIYVPFVSKFLYFSGPALLDWIYVIGSALIFLGVFEVMKAFKRRRAQNGNAGNHVK